MEGLIIHAKLQMTDGNGLRSQNSVLFKRITKEQLISSEVAMTKYLQKKNKKKKTTKLYTYGEKRLPNTTSVGRKSKNLCI
jgi:ribonucleotide monophosphatase NagD (HAD superfamily)